MTEPVTVPDVVAPPPRHPRFALIDGARAIAVLSIVLFHAAVFGNAVSDTVAGRLIAHLNVGVAIFFVISAFSSIGRSSPTGPAGPPRPQCGTLRSGGRCASTRRTGSR